MSQECYVGGTNGYQLPPYTLSPIVPGVTPEFDLQQGLCPPGFYCPNSIFTDPNTWPRYCPATEECLALRADKKYCGPQGPFEPIPCPSGSYCPNGFLLLPCPKGYWCPLGTQKPNKCHALMHCPEGSVDPPYDYSSIVAAGILDIVILIGVFFIIRRRRMWWGRVDDIFAEQTCAEEVQAAELARKLQAEALQRFEEENNVSCNNGPDEYGSVSRYASVSRTDRQGEDGMAILPQEVVNAITKSHREAIRDSPAYAILERGIRANRVRMMPMHIQFEQLSVVVPFKGAPKQLLKGITGAIVPGHVTAIMGPSGAGKTVFMTSLLNKVESNWKLTGKLTINGLEGSTLSDYQHMMGYVPQDDIMHPELTVMENIWFSAETRLPREWDPEDRLRYVAAVIKATGLEEVRHVVVGSGSEPNGVNRKRVCIAMELAAAPAAVFLDEPTTGLDAATALDLCYLLKDIAVRSQLTVAMVIHQPRVEIWESLDEVLLIAPGGRTVYQGPQAEAQDYFISNIGLDFSVGNPADIILDGISANQEACEKAWEVFIEAHPDRFGGHNIPANSTSMRMPTEITYAGARAVAPGDSIVDANQAEQRQNRTRAEDNRSVTEFLRHVPIYDDNGNARQNSASLSNDDQNALHHSSGELFPEAPPAAHATFIRQFTLVHYRSILKQTAHLGNIFLGVLLSIAAAAIMGTAGVRTVNIGMLISPYSLLNPRHTIYLIPMMMMFYLIAIASSTSASAIRALGEDRQQYWKEASTGRTNKLAYFMAMTTGEIYRLLITTMHFALVAYFMWNPLITFWWFFLILLLAFFANDSQGAMLGLVISPKHAPLLTTVAAVFISLLNGFPNIPGLTYIGYSFYLTEMAINRYVLYQELTQTNEVYEDGYFHYTVHRLGLDLGVVIGIIALYRVAAFMIMTLTNRNKQR